MRALKPLILAFVTVIDLSVPARADLTFAQWANGPADKRAIYTAGVLETVGVYSEVLGFVGQWKKCLATNMLSYGEIGEGALDYAKKRGTMNSEPAPAVIIAYINERCGFTAFRKPQ